MAIADTEYFTARADRIIRAMTLEEKVRQLIGIGKDGDVFGSENAEIFGTEGDEKNGIPPLVMGHAITGVRSGRVSRVKSTYFCTPIAIGCSWDSDLYRRVGAAMAVEMRALGQDVNLGPTINIIRHPLGGRNWESFSEDPFLTARLAVPFVRAMQEGGVICGPKHFAANNQEKHRFDINNVIDERTLREIYLPAFKAVVQEGGALNIMAAYNRVNGEHVCDNIRLLRTILREEWGFDGFVVSDFAKAMRSTAASVRAGVNIEMDAPNHYGQPLIEACRKGEVTEDEIDGLLREKLLVMDRIGMMEARPPVPASLVHCSAHQEIALEVARSAPVLLKNNQAMLPLDSERGSLSVIGPVGKRFPGLNPEDGRYALYLQGGGSGRCFYFYDAICEPLESVRRGAGPGLTVRYAPGCLPPDGSAHAAGAGEELRKAAVKLVEESDAAVLFCGLSGFVETEGEDRATCRLPPEQEELILAVARVQPRTIVCLIAGSYIDVSPWIDHVGALMFCPYAGEKIGDGLADILFGNVSPRGRLPFSWPVSAGTYPSAAYYNGGAYSETGESNEYKDGIFVGYRHFSRHPERIMFPFGFGLSYTAFSCSNIRCTTQQAGGDTVREVSVDVRNTGSREGTDVLQLYVRDVESSEPRPPRELKGFRAVTLEPGQARAVTFTLGCDAFSYFSARHGEWVFEPGQFELLIGSSERDIRVSLMVDIS